MPMSLAQGNQAEVDGKKPPQYEDFVGKSPFLRPWMEPYFPRSCYLRDLIIGSVGMLIGGFISWSLAKYGGNVGVALGLSTMGLTLWFVSGEIQGRYAAAGV